MTKVTKQEINSMNKYRMFWNIFFLIGIILLISGSTGGFIFIFGILLVYGIFLVKYRCNVIKSQFSAWFIYKKDLHNLKKSNFAFALGIVFIVLGILGILVGLCLLSKYCT